MVEGEKTINGRISLDREYIILHDLGLIDNSIFMKLEAVKELDGKFCSITRDVSIVLSFPHRSKKPKDAIPLTMKRITQQECESAYVYST